MLDLLTVKFLLSYSTRPLQIFGLLGLVAGALGGADYGYLGYVRLFAQQGIADRAAPAPRHDAGLHRRAAVTFGLLAELLARTYYESQNKPVYVIREILQTPEHRARGIMSR